MFFTNHNYSLTLADSLFGQTPCNWIFQCTLLLNLFSINILPSISWSWSWAPLACVVLVHCTNKHGPRHCISRDQWKEIDNLYPLLLIRPYMNLLSNVGFGVWVWGGRTQHLIQWKGTQFGELRQHKQAVTQVKKGSLIVRSPPLQQILKLNNVKCGKTYFSYSFWGFCSWLLGPLALGLW